MHRIAATPGGWNPEGEGVVFLEQTPAPLVFLTAADTDIQTLAGAISQLPPPFPALRVANLLHLQQPLTVDTYAEDVLEQAQVILLRLLGGRAYWSYGLEVVQELVQRTGNTLIVLPGDDRPDPELLSLSTIPLTAVNQIWRYFTEGGIENVTHALQFIADLCLQGQYNPPAPKPIPPIGIYPWQKSPPIPPSTLNSQLSTLNSSPLPPPPQIGILFYRAHYLAGNTAPIDTLCQALVERNLEPVPVFLSSLRDADLQDELRSLLQPQDAPAIDLLLNTMSFSVAQLTADAPRVDLWQQLNVPVLQVILSSGTVDQWRNQWRGLSPRDMAMNVALPEVDGRIITRAVSFKAIKTRNQALETDVVTYEPVGDRIQFVADLAANWVNLRRTPPDQRKVALILANYPSRDGRLANGVGLDTPASCVELIKALQQAGYWVENPPQTADELIQRLTTGITNDPEGRDLRPTHQSLSQAEYQSYFVQLPKAVQQGVRARWGRGAEEQGGRGAGEQGGRGAGEQVNFSSLPYPTPSPPHPLTHSPSPISGIQLGNVFIGIQPARGYDKDPSLNYHAPDLEPTYEYLAFYHWLRSQFGAQAIAHIGKHGNLEWLPGKSIALSATCYPEVALGPIPHLYPFIVNDPGEGAQAKRRSQAVILDHLTPPMTRAELYGPLQQLEGLIDEYYEAQSLNPSRLEAIQERIVSLIQQEKLEWDVGVRYQVSGVRGAGEQGSRGAEEQRSRGAEEQRSGGAEEQRSGGAEEQRSRGVLSPFTPSPPHPLTPSPPHPLTPSEAFTDLITSMDGYLCELKEAQIRDGLHIFGQCPQGRQLRDLIIAIARQPGPGRLGLTRALAQDWGWEFDPLTADMAQLWEARSQKSEVRNQEDGYPVPSPAHPLTPHQTIGDAIALLETHAACLVEQSCLEASQGTRQPDDGVSLPLTQKELTWIKSHLLPALQQTNQEITYFLRGLNGQYVPAGPAGAPTRGRPEVLPTGRNFYSVDIRAIPTETAWDVGRKAAEALIERYTQEHGEYPKTLGLSVWGTSCMRTGGDDLAEALALLGVKPVWEGLARRVIDFEILPLSVLGRPRVDVTLRISGFFRDAFPNLIDLFDQAVTAVADLDEPADHNPLAAQVKQETKYWQSVGLANDQARERSRYRIFGSKPGAYGAGLQGLIEAQNWTEDADLARAYINWSSYAYTALAPGNPGGTAAPEAFEQRLSQLQIVLQNQDNREHDLLDSDDYYQFQGGLTAAVRVIQGQNPETYIGDHSQPENPKIRRLQEEIARVYRSRVVNPKWLAGVMRHGYKGAFEMAATVDYLFAYDATAHCVEDFMYQGIAETYLFDPAIQAFVQQKNPWALRDMAERLLEANQRGLWQSVSSATLEKLRAIAHEAEGEIEGMT